MGAQTLPYDRRSPRSRETKPTTFETLTVGPGPVAFPVGEQLHLGRLAGDAHARGPHAPVGVAAHLVGEAERLPFFHAQGNTVGDHSAPAHRQAQVPEPGTVPRRPHHLAYHSLLLPSVPNARFGGVYELPRRFRTLDPPGGMAGFITPLFTQSPKRMEFSKVHIQDPAPTYRSSLRVVSFRTIDAAQAITRY